MWFESLDPEMFWTLDDISRIPQWKLESIVTGSASITQIVKDLIEKYDDMDLSPSEQLILSNLKKIVS